MKIGDRVETPDGSGEIVAIENPEGKTKRYGIKHDENPDWQAYNHNGPTPTYYWPHELKLIQG